MTTNYHELNLDTLMAVRAQYQTNLAHLELRAAQTGPLHMTTPQDNELADTRQVLTLIELELRRRAGGMPSDPPELLDIRAKITLFADALAEATTNQDELKQLMYAKRLAELREQEAAITRQHKDFAVAVRDQAQVVAADLERGNHIYYATVERQHSQRERFVGKRNLTLDLTLFRDRVREREQVLRLLSSPTVRLIQIIGTGGMGKTALASHALLTLDQQGFAPQTGGSAFHALIFRAANGPGGLSFESMVADIIRVCPERAEAIRALPKDGDYPAQVEYLLDAVGSVPILLVLDNAEVLMDTAGAITGPGLAALVSALLRPNHAWRVIMTSRRLLSVPSDQQRYLHRVSLRDGLPIPDAIAMFHDLDPDETTLIRRTPKSILKTIIVRLHGRPRLLEQFMALLRTSTYTPKQLLDQPRMLDLLTQTLHDWLTGGERAILRALAVFGVQTPRSAVEYLLLPEVPALDLDMTLARLSQIGVISQSDGLFSLHPIDAEVVLNDPSSANSLNVLHERAAMYYQQRELPDTQWHTIEDLAPQISQVKHLTAAGLYDAAAEVLGSIDGDYLRRWGHAARVIRLWEPLIDRLTQPVHQMQHEHSLGLCYARVGRVQEATDCYERGLRLAEFHHDRDWQQAFLSHLGNACADVGKLRQAIAYYEQQLVIVRELDDQHSEATAVGNLGTIYAALGEVYTAIEHYKQGLVLIREIGNHGGEGAALGNLGLAYADIGELSQAIDLHEQRLAIARQRQDRGGEAAALGNLGNAYVDVGEMHRAITYYTQAMSICRAIEDRRGEGACFSNLGVAYTLLGELQRAVKDHQQSLMISLEIRDCQSEAIDLVNLATCCRWAGDIVQAHQFLSTASDLNQTVENPHLASCILIEQGQCFCVEANLNQAGDCYVAALAINFPRTAGRAAWGCGLIAALQGNADQARVYWEDAAKRCATMNQLVEYRYLAAAVTLSMAVLMGNQTQAEEGLVDLRTILAEAPLPQRAAEILRDLRDIAQMLGETPALTEAIALLEPIAAQMQLA